MVGYGFWYLAGSGCPAPAGAGSQGENWLVFSSNGWVTFVGAGGRQKPSPNIDAVLDFGEDIEDGVEQVEVLAVEDADVDGGAGA